MKNDQDSGRGLSRSGITDMLTRDGALWRPFEDRGALVKPLKTPRHAKSLFAACEKKLVMHLKAVCLWPASERNESWRVGDYSYYVLEFEPKPKTVLYVQFWSQPGAVEGVRFEVCSGALDHAAALQVDERRQELLRDHGFEIGGAAGNFHKEVKVANARDARALAREAMALLCQVLGYDGRHELRFNIGLQSNSRLAHVFDDIAPDDVVALLREWGYAAELQTRDDGLPIVVSRTDHGPFAVVLLDDTPTGQYQSMTLRTFKKLTDPAQAMVAANAINGRFRLLQASVDPDGDVVIETHISLLGGVTAEHVRLRFEVWRGMLRTLSEA